MKSLGLLTLALSTAVVGAAYGTELTGLSTAFDATKGSPGRINISSDPSHAPALYGPTATTFFWPEDDPDEPVPNPMPSPTC